MKALTNRIGSFNWGFPYFRLIPLLFLLSGFLLEGCSTHTSIQSPNFYGRDPIELADSSARCSEISRFPEWYILYGIEPLSQPTVLELFPKAGRSYRLRTDYSWVDSLTSVILGFSVSITRRTVVVEDCGESLRHTSIIKGLKFDEVVSLIEKSATYFPEDSWDYIWLRDGSVKKGKVVEENQNEVLFVVYENNKEELKAKLESGTVNPTSYTRDQVLYIRYTTKKLSN